MTDGPFKNLKLRRCWQRLVDAVPHAAVSLNECVALASDALVRDLTTAENCSALKALDACSRDQLDLDPHASVEAIFDAREKTPFLDSLKKEVQFRVANGSSPAEVIPQALCATIEKQIGEIRNRFEEEFIYARDTHKISWEACQQALDKLNATFDAVDRRELHAAVRVGNMNAFKDAASKKEGLEEGPRL